MTEREDPHEGWEAPSEIEVPFRVLHDVLRAAEHAADDEDVHPERRDMWWDSIEAFRDEVEAADPGDVGVGSWPESMKEAWNETVMEEIRRG